MQLLPSVKYVKITVGEQKISRDSCLGEERAGNQYMELEKEDSSKSSRKIACSSFFIYFSDPFLLWNKTITYYLITLISINLCYKS